MKNTFDTLNRLLDERYMDLTLEEISSLYKETLNPSLLALAFNRTYKLILNVSSKFYGLEAGDVASFSLEKLDQCLQTYDESRAAFTTFYVTHLINKFREETQALNTDKRKVIYNSDSYEAHLENGYDIPYEHQDNTLLFDKLEECNLDYKEIHYCKLIIEQYTNREISEEMGVSIMTLSNIRKKLRLKLSIDALRY